MPRTLVLFDIDGTLLLSGRFVHDVFLSTAAELCGDAPDTMEFPFAGMTDRAIFAQLVEITGASDPDGALFAQFRETYPRRLRPLYRAATTPYLLPGVAELIPAMAQRPELVLGLATGNLRTAAHVKLSRFDLDGYFPAGGFGDHHPERWRVVQDGMAEARAHYGLTPEDPVWVVGDTPHDVTAARRAGTRVLAVATGFAGDGELAAADVVLSDLSDTSHVIEAILHQGQIGN